MKFIYSSFYIFPHNYMAVMDLRFIIAGSISLGGNSGSGLLGQNKGLVGNAFIQERVVQVNTSLSLCLRGTIYEKVHQLHFLKGPASDAT